MKIYTGSSEGITVIQNSFIDQYMPHANGEFVKVYLYLLRCADTDRDLSLASIADVFDHTEKDIQRALLYWEKQRLIKLCMSGDGTPVSVTFCDHIPVAAPVSLSKTETAVPVRSTAAAPTVKKPLTVSAPSAGRIAELMEDQDICQLFYVAEQYLQRPLTSTEQSDLIFYYDELKFSVDLIEYLIEYCVSKGSTGRHYMQKVALAWAEEGINTVLQAKQATNLYNKNYYSVLNAFGIKGRGPAAAEQDMMAKWFQTYGFESAIVLEACHRTIRQTHQPNFQYADKILKQWHDQKVVSLQDIEKLDKEHKKQPERTVQPGARSSGNRFNNFTQRDYDYSQLEKQLLNS